MFPGRKSSAAQEVITKPRCCFELPMKYSGRHMGFKWHPDLTQYRGNSASHRLKPSLDVSLCGPEALLSKMKTCTCLTELSYWTTHHGSSLRLSNIKRIKLHFFPSSLFSYRSVRKMLSKTCSPVQKSCTGNQYKVPIFILFIRFHDPKELCKWETEKRASSFLPPPHQWPL